MSQTEKLLIVVVIIFFYWLIVLDFRMSKVEDKVDNVSSTSVSYYQFPDSCGLIDVVCEGE